MGEYTVIRTDAAVADLASRLRDRRLARVAVDIEGENNLHAYGIRGSLIQGFDGHRAWVIDVLSLDSRASLAALLQESSWLKVMYDAGNDLLAFSHDLGLRVQPILDVAIAANLLGKPGGLHALAPSDRSRSAKDRLQKANWMRRPLPPQMLEYAVSDVLSLPEIADQFLGELARKGLLAEFLKKNWERQSAPRSWNPLANFGRIPGYQRLRGPQRRFARVLWYAREYYAQAHDVAPEAVASKPLLKKIVEEQPRDAAGIVRMINDGRRSAPIAERDFQAQLARAEKDAPADDP